MNSILIIDDDADLREALREFLKSEEFAVCEASNGLVALDTLRGGLRPDAIVLDLMMPVMDGWSFRSEQLKDTALRDVPVLVITASGESAESLRRTLQIVEVISKPFPNDDVLAALNRLCEKVPDNRTP